MNRHTVDTNAFDIFSETKWNDKWIKFTKWTVCFQFAIVHINLEIIYETIINLLTEQKQVKMQKIESH